LKTAEFCEKFWLDKGYRMNSFEQEDMIKKLKRFLGVFKPLKP